MISFFVKYSLLLYYKHIYNFLLQKDIFCYILNMKRETGSGLPLTTVIFQTAVISASNGGYFLSLKII